MADLGIPKNSPSVPHLSSSPAVFAEVITAHADGTNNTTGLITLAGYVCRGLMIQNEGNIQVILANGVEKILPVPAGILPLAGIQHIKAASTTASGFTALYDKLAE